MDAEAIKGLKRKAQAATPGPWMEFAESGDWWVAQVAVDGMPGLPVMDSGPGVMIQEDVDYIAAANPQAVLSLIAEVERLQGGEAEALRLRSVINQTIGWFEGLQSTLEQARIPCGATLGRLRKAVATTPPAGGQDQEDA